MQADGLPSPAVDPSAAVVATAPEEVDEATIRRALTIRRLFVTALSIFLALGLAGVFGVRTGTASASAGGYDLTVEYARVSRPGLATPWSVTVHHQGGFDGPVTISTTLEYLDMFDENGLDPDPSSSTTTEGLVIWEFDPPPGDTLVINFDARLEPAVQSGRTGRTAVLVGGAPVVEVGYRTWVMP